MKEISNKILRISFVFSLLFIFFLVVQFNRVSTEKKIMGKKVKILENKIKILEKENDSLSSEAFTSDLKLYRFQVAYEIFKHQNPSAASQYGDIISDETE